MTLSADRYTLGVEQEAGGSSRVHIKDGSTSK